MKLWMFFGFNPVFSVEDIDQFLAKHGTGNRWTRKSLIAYHVKQGHLLRLRRGLFAVVPDQADPDSFLPDPFLVAAKMTADATLAYHSALEYHGMMRPGFDTLYCLSRRRSLSFRFRSIEYRCVPVPGILLAEGRTDMGIQKAVFGGEEQFQSMVIRYTSMERTLVDVLDRPGFGRGWNEAWRSLQRIDELDIDQVIEYALLLGNATTVAKVGLFLEHRRVHLAVQNDQLDILRKHRPQRPHYLFRNRRRDSGLVKGWNLLVPYEMLAGLHAEAL